MPNRPVVHNVPEVSEQAFHSALVIGLARAAGEIGRDTLAERSGRTRRALDKLFAGDSQNTTGKGLLDFMRAHPDALNEVFALYGMAPPRPRNPEAANDLHTMTGLSNVLGTFCEALEDGKRDHGETLALADLIRPLMPALSQILSEANRIRGIAA